MRIPETETEKLHREVAAEVRASLARANLSGNQAAIRLGWKQQHISRRLSGLVPFSAAEIYQVARMLDVPVDTFFREPVGASRKAPSWAARLAA